MLFEVKKKKLCQWFLQVQERSSKNYGYSPVKISPLSKLDGIKRFRYVSRPHFHKNLTESWKLGFNFSIFSFGGCWGQPIKEGCNWGRGLSAAALNYNLPYSLCYFFKICFEQSWPPRFSTTNSKFLIFVVMYESWWIPAL